MMYTVRTTYPDGFTNMVCSLTFPAACYFKRMMTLRGAYVRLEPEGTADKKRPQRR